MSIFPNKTLVVIHVFRQLFGLILGFCILSFIPVVFASDSVDPGSERTTSLGDYHLQLVCDPEYEEGKPERCKIVITDSKSLDQSRATLNLLNTDILVDTEQNAFGTSSLFSNKALDKKEKTKELELQKYRISRDWLFRLKITEDGKEPDISILSIIVPNDKKTE